MSNYELVLRFNSVTILKNVFGDEVLNALYNYLNYEPKEDNLKNKIQMYSDFVSKLSHNGCDLGKHIKRILFEDENIFVILKSQEKEISSHIINAVNNELSLLSDISKLTVEDLNPLYDDANSDLLKYLPKFDNTEFDFVSEYKNRIARLSKDGYGIYSKFRMFKISDDGEILPVKSADTQTVNDLIGYEKEREKVISNTKALIAGKPAANILLYGAAGTGKSSTVKAVTNLLHEEGIRLIEVKKEQLMKLPLIMEEIAHNPLKFIIFIDDLTFNNDEKGFGTLKAILEGSASAKASNAVIYATSNRRHMVKETFSARDGDDIHREDTIQEQTSLSERFGLTVLFDKPNKLQYVAIVKALATAAGLNYDENEIAVKAEAFALRKGGRSARCARQFVDSLISEI